MRCLHCGSTLSAFKKLTDSDFCSTEHKDHFYTEQQQLIRERLKYSRTRLHRLSRSASGESRVTAPVMEAQAPARIAEFLFAFPDRHDRSRRLQFFPQMDPELSAANPPVRRNAWWNVITGPKPLFVNRMYRMRLKPAQDADTMARPIRTKHLSVPDPEPVLVTMPAPSSSAAAPSFLDRLYRMRPKGGKAASPATNAIPCKALESRLHSGPPAAILRSVSKVTDQSFTLMVQERVVDSLNVQTSNGSERRQ